ncbi:MAG: hypothetical protein M0041_06895 [Nitrospiraceae bacterium]|nr:hypothetical protein [Nitrospiraceae bacterium]
MAYVRFISDNFKSDVYAYESAHGFEVHVAVVRFESETPIPELLPLKSGMTEEEMSSWLKRHGEQQEWIDKAQRVPIGLSRDGKDFCFSTEEKMYEFLRELKKEGYRVPTFSDNGQFPVKTDEIS